MRRVPTRTSDSCERGAAATELAVLMPVLIMLVLIPVQVGLWWHAKQAAETAADEALDAATLVEPAKSLIGGGGRADARLTMRGGRTPEGIDEALEAARNLLSAAG